MKKTYTYEQGNAAMILTAEKLGLSPVLVQEARRILSGESVHVMVSASIESEATRLNDLLRAKGAEAISQANATALSLLVEYGLLDPVAAP